MNETSQYQLYVAGVTDKGMVRKHNEDSICVHKALNLFVVADGMGGHGGGDIASRESLEALKHSFMTNNLVLKAQSEARTGKKFCNMWLHAAFLTVDGERMGKSKGNYILVRELLEKTDPMLVRLFLVNSHYRKSVDYNNEVLKQTQTLLDRIRTTVAALEHAPGGNGTNLSEAISEVKIQFNKVMDDDLNTAGAIQAVIQFVKKVNNSLDNNKDILNEARETVQTLMGVLGIRLDTASTSESSVPALVELLIELRADLRTAKQFELADKIRASLVDLGIQLEDKPEGTLWKFKS